MSVKFSGTNTTGWIVYYICDRSGGGFDRPNYCYFPNWNDEDEIHEQIIHQEDWPRYAESYSLKVELGIIPPLNFLEKKINECSQYIVIKTKLKDTFIKQKDEFYGGLIRN